MLLVTGLKVVYQDVILALRGISFRVPPTGIVALLGANGAGKTTTLRAISGLLAARDGTIEDGRIELDGRRIDGQGTETIVRLGVAHVPEGRHIFRDLTVHENLLVGAYTRRDGPVRADYDRVLAYFPVLAARRGLPAGYLSGGEQQMLAIGR
ncbi:MAG: ATP-binding cassette domain-containing protein, partial [Candidatus Rokubacteria bacterium]|nr:ATP-binding cassette domain-containing protein [Candidatus Rokubacteria bacterium]